MKTITGQVELTALARVYTSVEVEVEVEDDATEEEIRSALNRAGRFSYGGWSVSKIVSDIDTVEVTVLE